MKKQSSKAVASPPSEPKKPLSPTPEIQILVASHKPYAMPESKLYLPIQVGKSLAQSPLDGFIGDNTGKHISGKNPVFCELTALYWAWQNLDADYIGLVHYRRHFKNPRSHSENDVTISADAISNAKNDHKAIRQLQKTLSETAAHRFLQSTDVILPKKRHYYITNLYDHYCHTMHPAPLEQTREIIAEQCPEYLPEFDRLKTRRSAHMFNMFIMRRKLLDQYCNWLFPILFALEKQIDSSDWTPFQKRYAGRISERLLDVWLNTHHISYRELPVISIEPTNWLKKGTGFLAAKFFGRQYEKSW